MKLYKYLTTTKTLQGYFLTLQGQKCKLLPQMLYRYAAQAY